MKELTKGFPGTKLGITLGAEFERGKGYTTQHELSGGVIVKVDRIQVIQLKEETAPVTMEPKEDYNWWSVPKDNGSNMPENSEILPANELEQKVCTYLRICILFLEFWSICFDIALVSKILLPESFLQIEVQCRKALT